MTLLPQVFKAYDVRGLYGEELDEDGAERIGAAFVTLTGARRIAIGPDVRLTSPSMAARFADGAAAAGADIVDLGLCATEMLYFAVADGGLDAGACITASHNPPQYTGMKLVRQGALPLAGDSGIDEVGRIAMAGPPAHPSPTGARTRDTGLLDRFIARAYELRRPDAITGLRVVLGRRQRPWPASTCRP